jgi:hypothetical protein
LAGQTSPGCAATYWAALILRSSSGVAADAAGGDLDELDLAFRVDHEGAAVGQADALA